jgi:hypothetical protein
MFVLLALLCAGCGEKVPVTFDGAPPPPIATTFERLPELLAGIPTSSVPQLYEGLPSEFWEPELLLKELARAKTIRLHGHPFYEVPLAIPAADGEQVAQLFAARTSFAPFTDGKKGGGFHADYGWEWKTADGTTHAILCLEIGEVKLYGRKAELHCDLAPDATQKLHDLLSRYRKNRPAESPSP